jgi:hypothetical protein
MGMKAANTFQIVEHMRNIINILQALKPALLKDIDSYKIVKGNRQI